ncbi:MAG: PTS sugar transporter subunit IIC [Clostridia bacterium]|nr:PTS sugar transporter subunit IIC [Clostridia bacterium]
MNTLKKYLNRYFIDAMGAMALGLFASLLIGTIFGTVGKYIPAGAVADIFNTVATYAKGATGMAIGVAIAYKLGAHPLVMFSCAAVGAMANQMGAIVSNGVITSWAVTQGSGEGIFYSAGPAGAFFAVIAASEIGMLVSKRTKVDILVTPVVTLLVGFAASWLLCSPISYVMYYLGVFIATATTLQPLLMGIVVSVVVGIILTLPISSAAICAMIFSSSAIEAAASNGTEEGLLLAGGAAVAGCCAQMVGFAVSSFRENKWSGIVSQGLGTSMLQMGNICKNPLIWIPPTLASAITGPVATVIFKLKCSGVAAGMGTCGLVGPIGVIDSTEWSPVMWIGLVLVCVILPACLSLIFSEIMRRLGWIKKNDMLLSE